MNLKYEGNMESQRLWALRPLVDVPAGVAAACSGQQYLAAALAQRGIGTFEQAKAFLDHGYYTPAAARELAGVKEGSELLKVALESGQKILVWGDFDADGQTSTALLVSGLKELALEENDIRWHVPHRIRDNHGVQPGRLQEKLEDPEWRPEILVTCDTGIDAVQGFALARAAGLSIIVTDHHDLPSGFGDYIPGKNAALEPDPGRLDEDNIRQYVDVIINPKLMAPSHPQATLPGVGVAYLLMLELFSLYDRTDGAEAFLDLVAIGIVADVADQIGDTRYWLQRGMAALNQSSRPGLHALLSLTRSKLGSLRTEDISFSIAPRMNAAGRMADASLSIDLLLTSDPGKARLLAAKLQGLNQERKELTSQMFGEALSQLERNPDLKGQHSIVLAHKSWHPGILGLVASQVTENFGLPSVLLQVQNDNIVRGSARSINGVDIGTALENCKDLLKTSGGHAQAAGLSMDRRNLPAFRRALDETLGSQAREGLNSSRLLVDRQLELQEINRQLWAQLQKLEPTGKGNPDFLNMSTNLTVEKWRKMGKGNSAMRRFQVRQQGNALPISAVWFRCPVDQAPPESIDLVYTLRMNTFRGDSQVELLVHSWRPHRLDVPAAYLPLPIFPFEIEDLRETPPPPELKSPLENSAWYGEGLRLNGEQVRNRFELGLQGNKEVDHLVIWTSPPSRQVLQFLLKAKPWKKVTLMAHEESLPLATELPQIVLAMCRFASSHREGALEVPRMAAKLGLTETVVKLCLNLLVDQGKIRTAGETVALVSAPIPDKVANKRREKLILASLTEALQEIRSFRVLYRNEESQFLLA